MAAPEAHPDGRYEKIGDDIKPPFDMNSMPRGDDCDGIKPVIAWKPAQTPRPSKLPVIPITAFNLPFEVFLEMKDARTIPSDPGMEARETVITIATM
jgi:hypothetical protein